MTVRALIIDDSKSMRDLFSRLLTFNENIEVVGTAADAAEGQSMVIRLKPDVILLDIEMPRVDGITFLRQLMHSHPIPVLIVSAMTSGSDAKAMEALRAGAIDVIPKIQTVEKLVNFAPSLCEKVLGAAQARPQKIISDLHNETASGADGERLSPKVIAIGASTGGTTAVELVLSGLNRRMPAVVVAMHLPARVVVQFARRLNDLLPVRVKQAVDGEKLTVGTALIAPGDQHITLRRFREGYRVVLTPAEPSDPVKPSVNRLFSSVAEVAGDRSMGIVLTGMGDDGAEGLLQMRRAGALTVAEDESSCVVFGMPKAAQALGGACRVLSLHKIHSSVVDFAER